MCGRHSGNEDSRHVEYIGVHDMVTSHSVRSVVFPTHRKKWYNAYSVDTFLNRVYMTLVELESTVEKLYRENKAQAHEITELKKHIHELEAHSVTPRVRPSVPALVAEKKNSQDTTGVIQAKSPSVRVVSSSRPVVRRRLKPIK